MLGVIINVLNWHKLKRMYIRTISNKNQYFINYITIKEIFIQDSNIQMVSVSVFYEYYSLKYFYFRLLRININKFSQVVSKNKCLCC